jgi:hypothetical protein
MEQKKVEEKQIERESKSGNSNPTYKDPRLIMLADRLA